MRPRPVDHAGDQPPVAARDERTKLVLARAGRDLDALLHGSFHAEDGEERGRGLRDASAVGVLRVYGGDLNEEPASAEWRDVEQHLAKIEVERPIRDERAVGTVD